MAEDIKTLIEKINEEGVKAAQEKAKEIEGRAKDVAAEILEKARLEAERITEEAKDRASKMQEKEKALLAQAGRDLLLSLRQEINAMLEKLIINEARSALTPEHLFKILNSIIQGLPRQEKAEIVISLNKDDLAALSSGLLEKLKDAVKKEIILKPVESIGGGFLISFDAGKSQFDFSDKALAEYIGTFLKPKLKDILQL